MATRRPARPRLNYGLPAEICRWKPIRLEGIPADFKRADLEFHGVDHSGASFEARVFLENSAADHSTPLDGRNGFVGAFHVFGHGGCFGDVGHCEVHGQPRLYDPRPAHPLTPVRKVIIVTEAVKALIAKRKKSATVTVVPVVTSLTEKCDPRKVLKFERLILLTYA